MSVLNALAIAAALAILAQAVAPAPRAAASYAQTEAIPDTQIHAKRRFL